MRVCVDGTANLHCTVGEQLAYHSPQTKIYRFFKQIEGEMDAPDVLSMHQMSFVRLRFAEN